MKPPGMGWLLRPVKAGMVRFESLLDGTVNLRHIALMNDYLDVEAENEARANAAARSQGDD